MEVCSGGETSVDPSDASSNFCDVTDCHMNNPNSTSEPHSVGESETGSVPESPHDASSPIRYRLNDVGKVPSCDIPEEYDDVDVMHGNSWNNDVSDDQVVPVVSQRKLSIKVPEISKNLLDIIDNMRKSITNLKKSPWLLSRSKDIQSHLESISDLLRSEDRIGVVVRLESSHPASLSSRYLVVVTRAVSDNDENREESVLLGIDVTDRHVMREEEGAVRDVTEHEPTVGLVLPITSDFVVNLEGDGGFTVTTRERQSPYLFRPTSVQAMWSALQCLERHMNRERALGRCSVNDQRFSWTSSYRSPSVASSDELIDDWIRMPDIESSREDRRHSNVPPEQRKIVDRIRRRIKDIMMKAEDLDLVTSKYIRETLEGEMKQPLTEYKQLINEEMLVVMRQMDSPSTIFNYLYLGSEWNASNLDELQRNRVGSIVNVTVEIDNFFPGMFKYYNVRVNDDEQAELMKHWQQTYDFISAARKKSSRVLVHCKMGVSRSASTVIAFAMKEYGWSLDRALEYVKQRRPCVKPNPGFMKQLFVYEGILNANRFHPSKMFVRCRSCSADNLDSLLGTENSDEEDEAQMMDTSGVDVVDIARSISVKGSRENIADDEEPSPIESDTEPAEDKRPPAGLPCFLLMSCKDSGTAGSEEGSDADSRRSRTTRPRRPSLGFGLRLPQRCSSWPRSHRVTGVTDSAADANTSLRPEWLQFLGPRSPEAAAAAAVGEAADGSPSITLRHKSLGMMPRGVTICH